MNASAFFSSCSLSLQLVSAFAFCAGWYCEASFWLRCILFCSEVLAYVSFSRFALYSSLLLFAFRFLQASILASSFMMSARRLALEQLLRDHLLPLDSRVLLASRCFAHLASVAFLLFLSPCLALLFALDLFLFFFSIGTGHGHGSVDGCRSS